MLTKHLSLTIEQKCWSQEPESRPNFSDIEKELVGLVNNTAFQERETITVETLNSEICRNSSSIAVEETTHLPMVGLVRISILNPKLFSQNVFEEIEVPASFFTPSQKNKSRLELRGPYASARFRPSGRPGTNVLKFLATVKGGRLRITKDFLLNVDTPNEFLRIREVQVLNAYVTVNQVAMFFEEVGYPNFFNTEQLKMRVMCTNYVRGTSSMTTPDAKSKNPPRMELGFEGEEKDGRHSAYDPSTIAHEYTHAVVERLVKGLRNLDAQPSRAINEAVCDFASCVYTGSDLVSAWQTKGKGIRSEPYNDNYSKRMTPELLSQRNIQDAGEVVCAALMDIMRNLIKYHRFTPKQCLKIVLESMRSLPPQPDFEQFREALILVLGNQLDCISEPEILIVRRAFHKYNLVPYPEAYEEEEEEKEERN